MAWEKLLETLHLLCLEIARQWRVTRRNLAKAIYYLGSKVAQLSLIEVLPPVHFTLAIGVPAFQSFEEKLPWATRATILCLTAWLVTGGVLAYTSSRWMIQKRHGIVLGTMTSWLILSDRLHAATLPAAIPLLPIAVTLSILFFSAFDLTVAEHQDPQSVLEEGQRALD